MKNNKLKPKSFIYSLNWAGIMLFAMGCLFLAIGIIMQLIPMAPEDVNVYHNGVRQPSTEAALWSFRLIFLLAFGLTGLILTIIGGVFLLRSAARRKRDRRLKQEGARLTAVATGHYQKFIITGTI